MKIAIASDHAGYGYKEKIKELLEERGLAVEDFGTDSTESTDYPLFVGRAARAVSEGECDRAIVLGGSGNGEAMVANRFPNVRCALCWSVESARLAREHNDANALSLGERLLDWELTRRIVETWLETPFEGGRHVRRIQQIETVAGK